MRKVILPKNGNSKVFKVEEFNNIGHLESDEVIIEVAFSGINFADILMRLGLYPGAPKLPFTPGYEASGIITEVGKEVTDLKVGDRVFCGSYFGAYSSHLRLPSWQVLKINDEMSLEAAAGLPVSFITAYAALVENGGLKKGDKVLIDCGTGALGSMCFQLVKAFGAEGVGLTSSKVKKMVIEERGARAYTHEEFEKSDEKDFNIILNSLGGKSLSKNYKRLHPCGHLVGVGASSFFKDGKKSLLKAIKGLIQMPRFNIINLMNDNVSVSGINALNLFEHKEFLSGILKHHSDFELNPDIDKVFACEDVSEAHEYIEQKKSRGKVLLKW